MIIYPMVIAMKQEKGVKEWGFRSDVCVLILYGITWSFTYYWMLSFGADSSTVICIAKTKKMLGKSTNKYNK